MIRYWKIIRMILFLFICTNPAPAMLLNGGEYNGVRLLARNTVRLMTMNQIGDLSLNIGDNRDNKFGFGFSIVSDSGSRLTPSQAGTYSPGRCIFNNVLGGPKRKYARIAIRANVGPHVVEMQRIFKALVYQAIND